MSDYRLIIELHAGKESGPIKVLEGVSNIRLRGVIRLDRLSELGEAIKKAQKGEDLLDIGRKFGLTPPIR